MGDDVRRDREGEPPRGVQGDPLPAFARSAVFGVHLLHRIQGQFRRVQGHGARALWGAEVRGQDLRAPDRRQGRRIVPAGSVVLRLLHRPDHDQREVRRPVRRPSAQAGRVADAASYGPGGIDPGGDRGGRAADDAVAAQGDRHPQPLPGGRGGAQLRGQRQGAARRAVRADLDPACGRGRRRRFGCRAGWLPHAIGPGAAA